MEKPAWQRFVSNLDLRPRTLIPFLLANCVLLTFAAVISGAVFLLVSTAAGGLDPLWFWLGTAVWFAILLWAVLD